MDRRFYCETAILICLALTPSAAWAEAPAEKAGGARADENEIVVTANRREETVQDVASAITAISERQLELKGADSFEGFARSVPGLTMNQATKNRAAFNIRGIATSSNGSGNTQDTVSVYVNDTPVTDTYAAAVTPDLRLFDVERVEVLRGPQGTLFGSGSLGGTIRIITNKPDAGAFAAAGRIDLGTTRNGGMRQRYDAMVNIPLVEDKLALRVVGYYRNEEGWVRNIALGTRNDTIDWGGRAALLWTPTDALSVKAEVFHQDSDPEDGDSWNPAVGKFRKSSPIAEGRPLNLTNYNLSIDYDIDGFATLTSSSTLQKSRTAQHTEFGPLLGAGTPTFLIEVDPWKSRFYVQELRLVSNSASRFQWVVGGFYINRQTDLPDYQFIAPGLDAFFGGILGSDTILGTDITIKSSEVAAYGDATFEIVDGLKLRGGARVFRTTADYIERDRVSLNFATFSYNPLLSFENHSAGTNATWRGGISYEPNRDLLFFANVSKGFRVGQVNANFGPSLVDPTDYVIPEGYEPDSTINYELGAKTSFLNGDVTLNLTGFYIDWKNIQINGTRISDLRAFVANAGKATVKGIEAEITARPARGVNLYTTVTVQDGKIRSVPTDIIVPASVGDRLPGLARWKLSGGFEYRWDVGTDNQAYVRFDGQFTDATPNSFADGGNYALFARNSEYATLDGSVGFETSWGSVALYGENLTNNDAVILKNVTIANTYSTLRPRTFGLRVTYRR